MEQGNVRNCYYWLLLGLLGLVILGIFANYVSKSNAANQISTATGVAQEALDRGQFTFAKANVEGAKMVITGNAISQDMKLAACAAAQNALKDKSMLGLPGVVSLVRCDIMAPGDATPKPVAQETPKAAPATNVAQNNANTCQTQLAEASKLGSVQFAKGGSDITIGQNILDKVADISKTCTNFKIEIGGHTDSGGDDAMNMRLSQSRANAVKTYLVSKGVNGENLISKGYGETKPLVQDNAVVGVDSELRQKNRRIEFTIVQ